MTDDANQRTLFQQEEHQEMIWDISRDAREIEVLGPCGFNYCYLL